MKIMHTMANEAIAQRPKRRYYSPEFKGQIVAECKVSGASVAGVALAHGVNANIVHRWMREQADSLLPAPRNEFVALNLPPPVEQVPAPETSSPPVARAIHVEVRRSADVVTVNWPLEDAASCAAWLRDWLL
jgi:transposase